MGDPGGPDSLGATRGQGISADTRWGGWGGWGGIRGCRRQPTKVGLRLKQLNKVVRCDR